MPVAEESFQGSFSIELSNPQIVNSFGQNIEPITVNTQGQITAEITNVSDEETNFAYAVLIEDQNGVSSQPRWITASIVPGQTFSPSISWLPSSTGTYTVNIIIWNNPIDQLPISETQTLTIVVGDTKNTSWVEKELSVSDWSSFETNQVSSTNISYKDKTESPTNEITINDPIEITTEITSKKENQSFVYLVRIDNSDGITIYLDFVEGNIPADGSSSPSLSWIPEIPGQYTTHVFLWDDLNNPTALSPPTESSFTVK